MRQAYDYWQNQPGNYPEPGTSPDGFAPREPPGGGGTVTRVGDRREATPAQQAPTRGRTGHHQAIQLPPLSSPKDGPPWSNRAVRPPYHTACAPQVEGNRHQINTRRRLLATAVPPKTLLNSSQWPTIHRPQNVPAGPEANRASVPPPVSPTATYLGGLPWLEPLGGFASPAVNALTRVDIACRHLGTKRAGKKPAHTRCHVRGGAPLPAAYYRER